MKPTPPRLADRLLEWFVAPHRLESLQGDLHEEFAYQVERIGERRAKWRYWWDVLGFIKPRYIRRHKSAFSTPTTTTMLRNYLKIAYRNLIKNKGYSAINIGGLAVGMAVAILIGLWVYDEMSFDKNFDNYNKIAQVRNRFTEPLSKEINSSNSIPEPIATALKTKYAHLFEHISLVSGSGDYSIKVGENVITKSGQFFEDGAIDMFSLKMLLGNKESLKEMQSVIVSETTAKSLFGDKNPINQIVKLNNKINGKITGVYANLPRNCSLGAVDFIGNFENLRANTANYKENADNWRSSFLKIFVQLADKVSIEQVNDAIHDVYINDTPADFKQDAIKYKGELWLYPMKQWYLYSEFKNGNPSGGRISFVWLFGSVGLFVLLLACINFINLTTARSDKRAKEVGIRKAIGSNKMSLVYQFMSESFMVIFVAFLLSILSAFILIKPFNEIANKNISLPFSSIYFWIVNVVFLLITTFISGAYPSFYLSSFQPIKVLKGTIRLGRSASLPRQTLVVIQFTVSVVLVIGTIVVFRQIQYAQNRPVGYDTARLLRIPMDDPNFENKKEVFRIELLNSGAVTDVAFSSMPVTAVWENSGGFRWKGKNSDSESSFSVSRINEDFGKTVGWKLRQGRNFSKAFGTDTTAVIINASAAKYMGIKNPIGEYITREDGSQKWQIIGVVDDLVADSPFEPVQMGLYWLAKNINTVGQLQLKINPNLPVSVALTKIEIIQKKLVPSALFQYNFVDEEYGKKFSAEQRVGTLSMIFAILAIFISCLGLFGLASFVAEQRTKEIGVRKVLGASVLNLWVLLSKDFVLLVLIGFGIAAPVAWYFLTDWLQHYTYRTDISWWIFAVSGLGALLITLLTVSFQSVKAALMNPVKSLRSE